MDHRAETGGAVPSSGQNVDYKSVDQEMMHKLEDAEITDTHEL